MARAALTWTLADLSRKTDISDSTILRFERGQHVPRNPYLRAMRAAFEDAGIVFNQDGSVRPPPGTW
jgi:transcriptional regulator with XRE-family HTH domain